MVAKNQDEERKAAVKAKRAEMFGKGKAKKEAAQAAVADDEEDDEDFAAKDDAPEAEETTAKKAEKFEENLNVSTAKFDKATHGLELSEAKKVPLSKLTCDNRDNLARTAGGKNLPVGDVEAMVAETKKFHGKAPAIRDPLYVTKDYRVIDGFLRYATAKKLNIEEVPVVVVNGYEDLDDFAKRSYQMKINKMKSSKPLTWGAFASYAIEFLKEHGRRRFKAEGKDGLVDPMIAKVKETVNFPVATDGALNNLLDWYENFPADLREKWLVSGKLPQSLARYVFGKGGKCAWSSANLDKMLDMALQGGHEEDDDTISASAVTGNALYAASKKVKMDGDAPDTDKVADRLRTKFEKGKASSQEHQLANRSFTADFIANFAADSVLDSYKLSADSSLGDFNAVPDEDTLQPAFYIAAGLDPDTLPGVTTKKNDKYISDKDGEAFIHASEKRADMLAIEAIAKSLILRDDVRFPVDDNNPKGKAFLDGSVKTSEDAPSIKATDWLRKTSEEFASADTVQGKNAKTGKIFEYKTIAAKAFKIYKTASRLSAK